MRLLLQNIFSFSILNLADDNEKEKKCRTKKNKLPYEDKKISVSYILNLADDNEKKKNAGRRKTNCRMKTKKIP